MKVYFQNGYGEERLLNTCFTNQDVHKTINKFLDEHNFTSYYIRTWKITPNRVQLDVGSHTVMN